MKTDFQNIINIGQFLENSTQKPSNPRMVTFVS